MDFKTLLNKEFVVFDGGMGTMLQAKGMQMGAIPELISIQNPEWILDIHQSYIHAGANVIYANTFGANAYKLKNCGYGVAEVIGASVKLAKQACQGTDTLVALDIGPIGQLLEPTGTLTFEDAYEIYKEQILAGAEADLIVFETQTDLYELKAAVLAAREHSDLPIVCTMTFEKNMRTFTGCGISNMVMTLEGLGVSALGVNCSLGPRELYPIVEEITKWTSLPVVIKPNAGLPDPLTNTYDISSTDFAVQLRDFIELGVKIFGGCCGTTPEYIEELTKMLRDKTFVSVKRMKRAAICSAVDTVIINQPRIIGERINPTGKKRFKEALLNQDMDYILNQAIDQVKAGAEILDVNVGLPDIDEKSMMVKAVKAIQSIVEVPLQLDSTIPEVLEAGLRVYNGKPIVNSVNGEEKSLRSVLPLVKKYGAAVVGLTLDENGIPKSSDKRFEIAKKIMNRALELGIPKEDVYIDCLTLTASAEQDGVIETLKAVRRVKEELGLKTVLGVSNISFGLPGRELINHTFLTMAMQNGLDLPIMNPNVASMTGSVRAFRLLMGYDKNSLEYIEAYNTQLQYMIPVSKPIAAGTAADRNTAKDAGEPATGGSSQNSLEYAIENGLKNDGARIIGEMLETESAMTIINEHLIPALDKAGSQFEAGKIFLPQLIMAADVAQAAFAVIKEHLSKSSGESVSKGKIVLATVKGDIHDIGKNIVKVLLENYGYTVIDLGKDVDYQAVVDAAIEHNVKLVGLSALMTTTLVSMEKTIQLLRENHVDCKVMVGGAVLTPSYAEKIGADFYSRDAKESVDIAKKVLG